MALFILDNCISTVLMGEMISDESLKLLLLEYLLLLCEPIQEVFEELQ